VSPQDKHWRATCSETYMRRSAGGRGKRAAMQYLACCLPYYALSYRDLEEIMLERGLHVDHSTMYRWVQQYAPELEKRCRPYLKPTTDSWRVDETYIKIKKVWMYLYRAVDSEGKTLDFWLSPTRDGEAAKHFFLKTLAASHTSSPRVINVDKNAAYPKAFAEMKAEGHLPESCELRQVKYLNNLVEQDHRFIQPFPND
jgi:transposase, IS6 family